MYDNEDDKEPDYKLQNLWILYKGDRYGPTISTGVFKIYPDSFLERPGYPGLKPLIYCRSHDSYYRYQVECFQTEQEVIQAAINDANHCVRLHQDTINDINKDINLFIKRAKELERRAD